jgi:hypothetical protein
MQKMKCALFFSLLILIFAGCKKSDLEPEAPEIAFVGFNFLEKEPDGTDLRIEMIIRFKDRNGDIGRVESEKKDACGRDIKDLNIFYEKYQNGIFTPFLTAIKDTIWDNNCQVVSVSDSSQLQLSRSLAFIQPEGNNKSIEGEISYELKYLSELIILPSKGRFRIFLKDRAGNKSNEIFTDELTITK